MALYRGADTITACWPCWEDLWQDFLADGCIPVEARVCHCCGETMSEERFQAGKMCCDTPLFGDDEEDEEDEDDADPTLNKSALR
jgi:hypothetical protein